MQLRGCAPCMCQKLSLEIPRNKQNHRALDTIAVRWSSSAGYLDGTIGGHRCRSDVACTTSGTQLTVVFRVVDIVSECLLLLCEVWKKDRQNKVTVQLWYLEGGEVGLPSQGPPCRWSAVM